MKMKVIHVRLGTTVLSGTDREGAFLKAYALLVSEDYTAHMEMVHFIPAFLSSMGTCLLAGVRTQLHVVWGDKEFFLKD